RVWRRGEPHPRRGGAARRRARYSQALAPETAAPRRCARPPASAPISFLSPQYRPLGVGHRPRRRVTADEAGIALRPRQTRERDIRLELGVSITGICTDAALPRGI